MLSKIKLYFYCFRNIKQIIYTISILRDKAERLEDRMVRLEIKLNKLQYYKASK